MGHRSGFSVGSAGAGLLAAPETAPLEPRRFRGFSYLLDERDDASRITIGENPVEARKILTALYSLLPLGRTEPNEHIPSGYTYLLQFVAHDLVETTVPFWAAAEAGAPSRNMRDEKLGLDTLYGGGPTACPIAFEPAGNMVDFRSRLRLGKVADAASLGSGPRGCPYRDLARLKLDDPAPPSNLGNPSQVYVADERSDDNTLLSQVVVLFSILHNAIAAKLYRLGPQAKFTHASTAVLAMYHSIIQQDLMERLLHEDVYKILNARTADSKDWLWDGQGIPLEFTHGAFRVGHAMVRPSYQVNTANKFDIAQVLGGPVVGDPVRDPLSSAWIVEWQRFFDFRKVDPKYKEEPNYSLKLDIHQQRPLDYIGDFQPVAANSPDHLTMRDWLSAVNARTWRLDKLIDAAKTGYPGIAPMDTVAIKGWLADLVKNSLGTAAAKKKIEESSDLLATDLPLPLYILLESKRDPKSQGARLGPLGSIIVGETIFRCLIEAKSKLADLVPDAQKALGGDWKRVADVKSMTDLVTLAADWAMLNDLSLIPFIAP